MAIEFQCVSCGKTLRVGDEAAGKKARCPGCGTIQGVPAGGSTPLTSEPERPPFSPGGLASPAPPNPASDSPITPSSSPSPFAPSASSTPFAPNSSPFQDSAANPFAESFTPSAGATGNTVVENPYASPVTPGVAPGFQPVLTAAQARAIAKGKVVAPALTMMTVSGISLIWNLFVVVSILVTNPRMDAGEMLISMLQFALPLGFSAAILIGAWNMLKLRHYGWAYAAGILSVIPCGGCCIITLPVGIWTLVLLRDPVVKHAFD